MKNILPIAAALALSAFAALGQGLYAPVTLISSQVVPGGATSNAPFAGSATGVIDATASENVGLQLTFSSMATNANNLTLVFQKSLDGSSWDSNQILSWAIAGNGTNTVVQATNIAVLGYGYLRVYSIANQNPDTTVTNITVKYSVKKLF